MLRRCWLLVPLALLVSLAALRAQTDDRLTTPPLSVDVRESILPINLPTALQLADARPLDIAVASERLRIAAAQLQAARAQWLPNIYLGIDYWRHDGKIQDVGGRMFDTSRSTFMAGAGPSAVFAVSEAVFAPLAQKQVVRSRGASLQSTRNDTVLAVAEAYFAVQQARGELAGARDVVQRAEDLEQRTRKLAPALVPELEILRTRTEASRRRQATLTFEERWQTTSAELARILRLDPSARFEPLEPPDMQVPLLPLDQPVDDLIGLALTNRPELASQQALVQATLQRLRQERLRPLVPSVLLRGTATNPAGTLSGGTFGGGNNSYIGNFGARHDIDLQVLWELKNLGVGNRALVKERSSENQLALLELFRIQDRIAAEVVQAHAQAQAAGARIPQAEIALKDALESVAKNFEGLSQTRSAGNLNILIVRPQEVIAAIQTLAQTYTDFYAAVADFNRAQFRLYRALGHPGQEISNCILSP